MIVTLLDDFVKSCQANGNIMPIYQHMSAAIQETQPVAHRWDGWELEQAVHLPDRDIVWPDAALCLAGQYPIYPQHSFASDIGQRNDDADLWCRSFNWSLNGALVFQEGPQRFDVIPLCVESAKRSVVIPDVQLHFTRGDTGWAWAESATGPVNFAFHKVMLRDVEDISDYDSNINDLGNIMSLYLGSYLAWLEQPGGWDITVAREPRLKIRNGKVKKVYREGTLGYKEWNPGAEGMTLIEEK